jgi:hypothetical protein
MRFGYQDGKNVNTFFMFFQDCQMVYLHTKNSNLGIFWKALKCLMLVYIFYGHLVNFTVIWYILWPFETFCVHLVYILYPFWYVVPRKIYHTCVLPMHTLWSCVFICRWTLSRFAKTKGVWCYKMFCCVATLRSLQSSCLPKYRLICAVFRLKRLLLWSGWPDEFAKKTP